MIAVVLCGGFGTRLRSVIGERQKCALEVGGRPWIRRVIENIACPEIESVLLLTGYHADEVERAVAGMSSMVSTLYTQPQGPDAALASAFDATGSNSLLVVNGDTMILDFHLPSFLRLCRSGPKSKVVRGPSLLTREIADAGIAYRVRRPGPGRTSPFVTNCPFLDIGSPAGLVEARRRFATWS